MRSVAILYKQGRHHNLIENIELIVLHSGCSISNIVQINKPLESNVLPFWVIAVF